MYKVQLLQNLEEFTTSLSTDLRIALLEIFNFRVKYTGCSQLYLMIWKTLGEVFTDYPDLQPVQISWFVHKGFNYRESRENSQLIHKSEQHSKSCDHHKCQWYGFWLPRYPYRYTLGGSFVQEMDKAWRLLSTIVSRSVSISVLEFDMHYTLPSWWCRHFIKH